MPNRSALAESFYNNFADYSLLVCRFTENEPDHKRIPDPVKHLRWSFFAKIVNVNYFRKKAPS